MYKHILIPTDGSQLSSEALVESLNLAKSLGARTTICLLYTSRCV